MFAISEERTVLDRYDISFIETSPPLPFIYLTLCHMSCVCVCVYTHGGIPPMSVSVSIVSRLHVDGDICRIAAGVKKAHLEDGVEAGPLE